MKDEISSLELYYLVKELQVIIGGRIDKVYQRDNEFLITMHVTSKGKKYLKISLPSMIYITEYKEEFEKDMPGFCMFLRKHLSGMRIVSVEQKGFERILRFAIEGKDKKLVMIVELFSNGNLVLCDENMKIMSGYISDKWKDRTVRGGIVYEYPPEQVNTLELTGKEFVEIINTSKMDSVVKTLAVNLGLGSLYAEELCAVTGVDKTKKKPIPAEVKRLFKQLKELFTRKIDACIVKYDILPFSLKLSEKQERKSYETFSEAIDSKFSKKIIESQKLRSVNTKNEKLEKIKVIINQQETTIKGLEKSSLENQRKGELLYENYEAVKKVLTDLTIARKTYSWKEIKERLKGHKLIKNIDEKEGKVTIEL